MDAGVSWHGGSAERCWSMYTTRTNHRAKRVRRDNTCGAVAGRNITAVILHVGFVFELLFYALVFVLVLGRNFPVSCLNTIFLHRERPVDLIIGKKEQRNQKFSLPEMATLKQ